MKQTDKDKIREGRYRQFAGCDTLKASAKLSMMRDAGLQEMKGRGKATCYVPGDRFPIAKHETTPLWLKLHHLAAKVPHLKSKLPHLAAKLPHLRAKLPHLYQKIWCLILPHWVGKLRRSGLWS